MDLFTPIVSSEAQHPYFRAICERPNRFDCDVLSNWAKGFVDRDTKFVREFQATFDSSFWELYIFAALKHYRLNPHFSFSSPDFVINNNTNFCIEATVARHAQGAIASTEQKDISMIPRDLNEFTQKTVVRLRNSIDAKANKYLSGYATLEHVKKRPFVLAVTAMDSPFMWLACQRGIEAVLYGYFVDEERYLREGGELYKEYRYRVRKQNGSEVPIGIFCGDEFEWLSAIIFSSCATWGKVRALSDDPNPSVFFQAIGYNPNGVTPHLTRCRKSQYTESLLDGLRVYHNPFAKYPLDPSVFRHRDVFQAYYNEAQGWVYEYREGLLLSRTVYTIVPS